MPIKLPALALGVAFVTLTTGCATLHTKMIADLHEITPEIETMTVMPPTFSLGERGAFSGAALSEANKIIEDEILAIIEDLVEESSFGLARLDSSDSLLAADPELRAALFKQDRALSVANSKIVATPRSTIDVDYTADLDLIADTVDADHFLFVSGSGWFMSTGAQVKEGILVGLFGTGAGPTSVTELSVVLVDATRSKVLWHARVSRNNKDPRKPRDLLLVAQALMAPLLGKSRLQGDKSRDDALVYSYKQRVSAFDAEARR